MRLLPILLVFVTLTASAAVPLPPEKDKWLNITAGEFHIYSNSGERETKEIATNLLRMREAIGKVTQLSVQSPLPTYVFIFRNERSFAPYRDALFGRRNAMVSGGFLSSRVANFVVLNGDANVGIDRVVYHELTHYFVRNTSAGLPLWLDEGLAEYYSTFTANDEKVSIGRPIHEHVNWLREHPVIPLAKHFAVDVRSPEYSEGSRQGAFYAQSWALLHYFLVGSEERRQQLVQFLALRRAGKTNDDAFREAFRTDYATLEQELRSYVRKPSMGYRSFRLEELAVPALPALRPVARDELLYALGSLYAWNAGTQADGEMLLHETIRINPRHAEAHAILGYLREARNDRAGATALYEKAVALGSRDAAVYVLYGATVFNRKEVKRARELFERAAQLEPGNARAWAGIGATYVGASGDLTPGIQALEKSLSLAASAEDVALNLIQLYARTGRRDDAQRLNETILARSSEPEHVKIGREAVLMADLRIAEDLYKAGKHKDAIDRMRIILEATSDPMVRTHLTGVIASYDGNVAREKQVDAIRAVLAKADQGKLKEALRLLDELLPTVTDADVKRNLEKLRKELASRSSPSSRR